MDETLRKILDENAQLHAQMATLHPFLVAIVSELSAKGIILESVIIGRDGENFTFAWRDKSNGRERPKVIHKPKKIYADKE